MILVGVVPVFIFVRPVSNNNNDNDDDVVNDVRTDTLNHIGLSIGAPYSSLEWLHNSFIDYYVNEHYFEGLSQGRTQLWLPSWYWPFVLNDALSFGLIRTKRREIESACARERGR